MASMCETPQANTVPKATSQALQPTRWTPQLLQPTRWTPQFPVIQRLQTHAPGAAWGLSATSKTL